MRKFLVNVNGTNYEIQVEEIDGNGGRSEQASVAAPAAASGAQTVNSPMPGNILSVNVKPGDAVKAGQILMILEAMKMENEILAPADGTVDQIFVQKNTTVETGAPLCSIQ